MAPKGARHSRNAASLSGKPARHQLKKAQPGMTQFRVSDDGRLMDEIDSHAVQVLKEELPWADGLAVDTYLALSKGYWSLWSMFSAYCSEFELSVPRFNLLWLLYNTRNH